ncbi:MAG TPA: glycerate kinase, partial [Bacteroidales bacterium]|nr:glycerate kinase [Bacteroidales bacterium]
MRNRDTALQIFLAGVRSVLPEKLITDILSLKGQVLVAGSHEISLGSVENIRVIGAGKASAAMGHYVECILGDRISGGHIVVKYGHSCLL